MDRHGGGAAPPDDPHPQAAPHGAQGRPAPAAPDGDIRFHRLLPAGDAHAPESYTIFQRGDSITFSFSEPVEVDKVSYFTVIGTGSYTLEYSADGASWSDLALDQAYNTLLKWKVIDLNNNGAEDTDPTGTITAKLFRISAAKVDRAEGLWLGELALWSGDTPLTPAYVDEEGFALFDEPQEWAAKATYMNSSYFDEIYHARTALEHLANVYPYEVSHPPLGKLILSLGILLFGMTPSAGGLWARCSAC